jgi:Uma2 family endonuclease
MLKPYVTPEQYLEIERAAEYKSEYFNGEIFAKTGETLDHVTIAGNVICVLHGQLRGRCRGVVVSNLRLQVSPDGLYCYPDVLVFCGEPQLADGHNDTLTDATVVIEVLSPSTENYDRGFKFEQYRRLKSLMEYIVIAQDRVHVEQNTRQPDGAWMLRETSDRNAVIHLPSIECSFTVDEAYEQVDFGLTGR